MNSYGNMIHNRTASTAYTNELASINISNDKISKSMKVNSSSKQNIKQNALMLSSIIEESKVASYKSGDNMSVSANKSQLSKGRLRPSLTERSCSPNSIDPRKKNFDGQFIPVKNYRKANKNQSSCLNKLRYVQSVQFSTVPTWIMKFSFDNRFLATGGQDGILRIWDVLSPDDETESLVFIKNEPFREYIQHTKDIVDISWNSCNFNCILTASHDKSVILWNINDTKPTQIYTHPDLVTSLCFKPEANIFVTGSFDKIVRLWSIQHKRVINWIDTNNVVTAIQFSTDGERLVCGMINGDCLIYDTDKNNLTHLSTIKCRNRKGIFSKGRKVIDIRFTCNREALVTTCDSRIRYISLNSLNQLYKYKGHKNKSLNIRASISEDLELIMSASEDGQIYVWRNLEINDFSCSSEDKNTERTKDYESFYPTVNDKDNMKAPSKKERTSNKSKSACAIFTPLELVSSCNSKLLNNGIENRTIKNIILVATLDGRIKVFHSEISIN